MISQKVQVDHADQQVHFTLVFDHAPDFQTFDSFGRPEDSFQYEIIPNTGKQFSSLSFGNIRTVIRGDEIGSGNIPIRDGLQNGSDPNFTSGGWGFIRATVPFQLQGDQLSFAAGFNQLDAPSGLFSYRVFTTNFGSTVSIAESVSVPTPPVLPISLAVLGLLAAARVLTRHAV